MLKSFKWNILLICSVLLNQIVISSSNLCVSNAQIHNGKWITKTIPPKWSPNNCSLYDYTRNDIIKCFSNKKIALYGDSLLLNVYKQIDNKLNKTFDKSHWRYAPNGYTQTIINNNGKINYWWAPSAYHQQPFTLTQSNLNKMDIVIIGISVWDMGTYYNGIDKWFNTMLYNLQQTRNKMKKGSTLLLMNLHKLWPERCQSKDGPCYKCNDKIKEKLFRDAIHELVACIEGVQLYDTFGLTNTNFASKDGKDSVHYGKNTTFNEMTVLLNLMCERNDASIMKPTNFKKDESKYNCKNTNYDELFRNFKPQSQSEECISNDFKPAHN